MTHLLKVDALTVSENQPLTASSYTVEYWIVTMERVSLQLLCEDRNMFNVLISS